MLVFGILVTMNKTEKIVALLITKDYIERPEGFGISLSVLMTNYLKALMGDEWSIEEVDEKKFHLKGLLNDLAFLLSGEQIEPRHAKKILEDAWDCEPYAWDTCWYLNDTKILEEASGDGLKDIVAKVIESNPDAVEDVKTGKKQAIGFLVGQVMKEAKGKANPNQAREEIEKQING